ncbi:MAG TPA: hypothetical protein VNK05_11655 [Chloroflexota bacterium]|nr:hypothetical protein [Chloroflexota bacterium]
MTSEVPLPLPPLAAGGTGGTGTAAAPAGWTIRRAAPDAPAPAPAGRPAHEDRCDGPCHGGRAFARVHRGPDGDWLWHESAGTCHVSTDGRRVTVYARPGADAGALALQLLGPVAGRALHRLGHPALHASAVVLDAAGGAVAFLGPSGQGKTTLTAALLTRGATLLTDDVLPLWPLPAGGGAAPAAVLGGPGAPLLKVWDATARHTLGIRHTLPRLTPALAKKRLTAAGSFPQAAAPVRLVAIYLLQRFHPAADAPGPDGGPATATGTAITPLDPRLALTALLGQTYRGELLTPAEAAALLPLYARLAAQTPLRRLRCPDGFRFHDEVCARVLADAVRTSQETGPTGPTGPAGAGQPR